jgi:hypothetical protein
MPLPKKYKEKYKAKQSGSEQAAFFMFKVVGLVAIFFFFTLFIDISRFLS